MLKGHCPIGGESSVFINFIRIVLSMTLFFCSALTILWCSHHSLLSACSLRLLALLLLWNHFLVEWMFSQVWNLVHNPRMPYQLICTFILFLASLVLKAIFSKLMKPILYWLGSGSWRQCHITGGDLVSELWARRLQIQPTSPRPRL